MCDSSRGWKRELFEELLSQDILQQIATNEIHQGEEYKDPFSWVGSSDGELSVKAAMTFIKSDSGANKDSVWQ